MPIYWMRLPTASSAQLSSAFAFVEHRDQRLMRREALTGRDVSPHQLFGDASGLFRSTAALNRECFDMRPFGRVS